MFANLQLGIPQYIRIISSEISVGVIFTIWTEHNGEWTKSKKYNVEINSLLTSNLDTLKTSNQQKLRHI